MALPNTLLLTYQIEFQSTDITIEELCKKYDVTTKDLKGYTKWTKDKPDIEVLTDPKQPSQTPENAVTVLPSSSLDKKEDNELNNSTKETVLADVKKFKGLAIAHAIAFMENDAEYAEVKEFKDMVAVVDSIEKSYKDVKDNSGTTINMVVQNLVQKFEDDC